MKTVAPIPSSRAAQATACPWLPALAAITPAARWSSSSVESLLTAPRTLNAPVRCRFSAFSVTRRPTRRESESEPYTGVTRAYPAMRSRAALMSVRVGLVVVANAKHLLEDLTNRGQRIEPACLHVVQEPPQLRIVLDGVLQVASCPRRGDLEHLLREVRASPALELALCLEPGAVLRDLLPERADALTAHRLGQDDRRLPPLVGPEGENLPYLGQHRLRERVIHLVDRDHVGDLHDPCLQRLDRVARARHQRQHDGVGDRQDADLALPGTDGLEEDDVLAGRIEHEQRLQRRFREPTGMAARAHRADEHVGIEEVVREADPVTEERPVRERARRVDRDDADLLLAIPGEADERRDERRLADARRPRHSDGVRMPGLGIEIGHDLVRERVAVLDQRDRARERTWVAVADARSQRLARPVTASGHDGRCYAACSRASAASAGIPRASTSAVNPPAPRSAAATTYVQRGPASSVSAPEATIAIPRSRLCALMISVNARPRSRSSV